MELATVFGRADGAARERPLWKAVVKELRIKQWAKNGLVFLAPLAGGLLLHGPDRMHAWVVSFLAFFAFCFAASGTYVVNDLFDRERDALHKKKRFRPIAAGEISLLLARLLAGGLFAVSVVIGLFINWEFLLVLLIYVALTLMYSSFLKHMPVIEMVCVAAGFVLRAVAGGVMLNVALSVWFLLVVSFGALCIVVGKRLSELTLSEGGEETRPVISEYTKSFLESALTLSAGVAVVSYFLWTFDHAGLVGSAATGHQGLFLRLSALPVVVGLLWVLRELDAGEGGAPEEMILHDKVLWGVGALWVLFMALGAYL